ncbi:MAG: acylphosphatase [Bacteroidota bacterium]
MVQYKIEISGRVQGVGFRYFVQKKADELNIKGWVKNTPQGSVVAMAQGDETDVETFIDYLRMGPSMARVTNLSKNQMPKLENFSRFEVRY